MQGEAPPISEPLIERAADPDAGLTLGEMRQLAKSRNISAEAMRWRRALREAERSGAEKDAELRSLRLYAAQASEFLRAQTCSVLSSRVELS